MPKLSDKQIVQYMELLPVVDIENDYKILYSVQCLIKSGQMAPIESFITFIERALSGLRKELGKRFEPTAVNEMIELWTATPLVEIDETTLFDLFNNMVVYYRLYDN